MKVKRGSFLTVNFYCLPHPKITDRMSIEAKEAERARLEKLYKRLHSDTVSVARSFDGLGVESEADMLNLFHSDLMSHGLGTEVKVVIQNVPLGVEARRNDFLRAVMEVISEVFPDIRKIIGEAIPEKNDRERYLILESH